MATTKIINTVFELKDGRILECNYSVTYWPGSYSVEEEWHSTEPVYTLDGVEVTTDQMPQGLSNIAHRMLNAYRGEFGYKETRDLRREYEIATDWD